MESDVPAARRTMTRLGDLLRSSLATDGPQEVALREELDLLGQYLDLQRMRYGERLEVELDVAHRDLLIPRFLLQPLVENTLPRGVARREGVGRGIP